MNTDPVHWSRAWFRLGSNCDSVDNNICESFNKWIIEARFFPIITMLETIRRKVMVRIQQMRAKSETWTGPICPNILKKLNALIKLSGVCHAICNGEDKFEVKHWNNRFTVDLQKRECSCRYWQLAGLPCPHAISSIFFKTNSLDEYIAPCYHVTQFKNTYSHCLNPVEGMQSWPESDMPTLRAPGYVKMPGRPKKERRREPQEQPKARKLSKVGTVIRCRKCKGTGHNRSTCDRRHGVSGSANVGESSANAPAHSANAPPPPPSMPLVSSSNQSTRVSKKRKTSSALSQQSNSTSQNVSGLIYIFLHLSFASL